MFFLTLSTFSKVLYNVFFIFHSFKQLYLAFYYGIHYTCNLYAVWTSQNYNHTAEHFEGLCGDGLSFPRAF